MIPLRKRLFSIAAVLLFLFIMLSIGNKETGIIIDRDTQQIATFNVPINTAYYVIATPQRECTITGVGDIEAITKTLSFAGYTYDYSGEFKYGLILSCINDLRLSECNLLVKDNYLVNGNMVFELNFNLENYLKAMMLNY